MLFALVAVTALAIAAIAGLVLVTVRSRLMPAPSLTGKTLVVHTRRPDDQTIRGILVGQHADRLILREAIYMYGSGQQAVAGLVHVPTGSVSWVQEIDGSERGASAAAGEH